MTETSKAPPILAHGGSGLDFLATYYPDAPLPWIDLSTGINPWSYPADSSSASALQALPSPSLYRKCREAMADYLGIDAANIAMLPGSQAAISLTPRLFPTTTVAVVEPTYGEHRAAWHQAEHRVSSIANPADVENDDILVITNPNNPDGRHWARSDIERMAARQTRRNGWLIVDEAFADVLPQLSAAQICSAGNVIVFRSFGKFFGLAGVRLGFAIAPEAIVKRLEEMIGPWAVSGLALETGASAYRDKFWHDETRTRLSQAAARLRALLNSNDLSDAGGTDLFLLAEHPGIASLFDILCQCGIYARRFLGNTTWLRFGLPADEEALARLELALTQWKRSR
jgi:cobalamin biosynthesis protein CobC